MPTTPHTAGEAQKTLTERMRMLELACYRILDTEPEPAFDDITRLASDAFGMPIALVTLVDESRQWFKSRVGLDVAETPREIAFCAHAIERPDQVMVIEDARADPMFRDNPLVTGAPHIRFYAGAPLVNAEGAALGTVCVIDSRPRQFSAAQSEQLRLLSRLVMGQLELRRVSGELLRTGRELAHANQMLVERITQSEKVSLADPVTGAHNQRFFDASLMAEIQRAIRFDDSLAIVLFEIDRFEPYQAGDGQGLDDMAMRLLATVVRGLLRPHEPLARLGEQEFAVIVPGANEEDALMLAERITQRIRGTRFPRGRVLVNAGYATFEASMPHRDLVRLARRSLAQAKSEGGDRVGRTVE